MLSGSTFFIALCSLAFWSKAGADTPTCLTDKSGSQACLQRSLSAITIHVGDISTTDDVFLEICSDFNITDCCTTPALKAPKIKAGKGWAKNTEMRWDAEEFFGKCAKKVFNVTFEPIVSLSKNGAKDVSIDRVFIELVNKLSNSTDDEIDDEIEKLECEGCELSGNCESASEPEEDEELEDVGNCSHTFVSCKQVSEKEEEYAYFEEISSEETTTEAEPESSKDDL